MRVADESAIRDELGSDVVLIADGGGLVESMDAAIATAEEGRDGVAAVLAALCSTGTSVVTASINGAAGVVLSREGTVVAAVAVQARADLLSHIWVVRNPEKLLHWNRTRLSRTRLSRTRLTESAPPDPPPGASSPWSR
jgi:hypothetical protein